MNKYTKTIDFIYETVEDLKNPKKKYLIIFDESGKCSYTLLKRKINKDSIKMGLIEFIQDYNLKMPFKFNIRKDGIKYNSLSGIIDEK